MRRNVVTILLTLVPLFGMIQFVEATSMRDDTSLKFLQIRHVGEEDKPIPTLIITANVSLADRFKDASRYEICLVNPTQFEQIISFWRKEANGRRDPELT